MSFTAGLIWREATTDGDKVEHGRPPEFVERYVWASWRSQFEDVHEDLLKEVGCEALLAVYMTDFSEDQNVWTTPDALSAAAKRLKALVESEDDRIAEVVELYEAAAEDTPPFDEETPVSSLLQRDLDVLAEMAAWAEARGMTRIALELG